MKTLRLFVAAMFFAAFASVSAFAQTGAAATTAAQGNTKVAIIDTSAFADEKNGIQKFIGAYKQLDTQFKPRQTEIQTISTRLKTIQDDYNKLLAQSQQPNSPVSPDAVQKKLEEGQALQIEYNRKLEDYKQAVGKAEQTLVGPIYQDIGKAIQDYAKARGYTAIIDISKDQNAMIVWADMSTVDATTIDFIKFYNARPAGTASTGTPK